MLKRQTIINNSDNTFDEINFTLTNFTLLLTNMKPADEIQFTFINNEPRWRNQFYFYAKSAPADEINFTYIEINFEKVYDFSTIPREMHSSAIRKLVIETLNDGVTKSEISVQLKIKDQTVCSILKRKLDQRKKLTQNLYA